jgi:hypothetical protein
MTDDKRRLLELLAASADGCTEGLLRAHGFTGQTIADLIDGALVTATAERMLLGNQLRHMTHLKSVSARTAKRASAGRGAVEITKVRITEAGRQALAP